MDTTLQFLSFIGEQMEPNPKPISISPEAYELEVKKLLDSTNFQLHEYESIHRKKLDGMDGVYEIDIVVRFSALGTKITVLVECKHHQDHIKRETVQVLNDRLRSLGANKGIMFSTAGFQKGAIKYAKQNGIALINFVDGKTTYITKSVGVSPDPPPWANIPGNRRLDGDTNRKWTRKSFTCKHPTPGEVARIFVVKLLIKN